jgi:hypothetical protein
LWNNRAYLDTKCRGPHRLITPAQQEAEAEARRTYVRRERAFLREYAALVKKHGLGFVGTYEADLDITDFQEWATVPFRAAVAEHLRSVRSCLRPRRW